MQSLVWFIQTEFVAVVLFGGSGLDSSVFGLRSLSHWVILLIFALKTQTVVFFISFSTSMVDDPSVYLDYRLCLSFQMIT